MTRLAAILVVAFALALPGTAAANSRPGYANVPNAPGSGIPSGGPGTGAPSTLPFTGLNAMVLVVAGTVLVGTGLVIRRATRA